jgi:replicative DNA helicase
VIELQNENNAVKFDKTNVQSELLFCGCMYKEPDLYLSYGESTKSKYDISDDATRFFYDLFEDYYLTFSQDVSQNKINTFVTQNTERLKLYKSYGGWKTIRDMMDLADPNDFKNVFNTIKKYSLIREYDKQGFPAEKMLSMKNFQYMTAHDVYRMMRSKADKINTVINVIEEPVVLTKDISKVVDSYLLSPQFGVQTHWKGYNDYFRGLLPGNVLFQGFLSNEGKSRNLVNLIAYVTLVKKQKFMLLSNEMTEDAMKNCLITTVLNCKEFKELHGVKLMKPEKEITMGMYRDDVTGEFVERKNDGKGNFTESEEDFLNRIKSTKEYKDVIKVAQWMEEQMEGRFYFNDITSDYSDEAIELEIRRAKLVYNCNCFAVDTLKAWGAEDWVKVKATATKIVELGKELKLFGMCTFQLTDATVFDSVFDLSSNNIGAAKGIKHPVDLLTLGKRINPEEYHMYQYLAYNDDWGEEVAHDLNPCKKYFSVRIDKNRLSEKDKILLFDYDLNFNTWYNVGLLIKKK